MSSKQRADEKFYMDQVFAGDINVDHEVQRELNSGHVYTIRKNMDQAAMGVIYLSKRSDGSYHCLDGQHRVWAMRELDPTFIFNALVYENLTLEREAELFIRFNEGRKAVGTYDKFIMHLKFGDQPHTSISDMLHSRGLEVGRVASANRIGAVGKLVDVANEFNLEVLDLTIAILSTAWSRDKDTWRSELIGAVSRLIYYNPQINTDDLSLTLRINEPINWVAMKDKGASTGKDADRSIARELADRYNKGDKSQGRPSKRGRNRITADPQNKVLPKQLA